MYRNLSIKLVFVIAVGLFLERKCCVEIFRNHLKLGKTEKSLASVLLQVRVYNFKSCWTAAIGRSCNGTLVHLTEIWKFQSWNNIPYRSFFSGGDCWSLRCKLICVLCSVQFTPKKRWKIQNSFIEKNFPNLICFVWVVLKCIILNKKRKTFVY